MKKEEIAELVAEQKRRQGGILSILQDIQARDGYLSSEALTEVARESGRSLVDLYGIATFYRAFSLKPRGKHCISVCLGTACHVRGAPKILEEFCHQLEITAGETTPDNKFTLETVNCLGACALGPTVVIDGHYFRHVKTTGVRQILDQARKGFGQTDPASDERVFPLEASCSKCNRSLMDRKHTIDRHPSITLGVLLGGRRGKLRLSSLYGSSHVEPEFEIPDGSLTALFCPHCKQDLAAEGSNCPDCGTAMAMLCVGANAAVHVCTKRGCPGHRLDLVCACHPPAADKE